MKCYKTDLVARTKVIFTLACVALFCFLMTPATGLAADQIVTLKAIQTAVPVGNQATFTLSYTTSDQTTKAAVIGMRLHYDSSKLTFSGYVEGSTYEQQGISANLASVSQTENDLGIDDGDPDTNSVVTIGFSDLFALLGQSAPSFPSATMPVNLVEIIFDVEDDSEQAEINVIVDNPDNNNFDAAVVNDSQAVINGPPPLFTVIGFDSASPTSGPTTGGTTVLIEGTGFEDGLSVRFGENDGQVTGIRGTQEIIAVSPQVQSAGFVDVVVTQGGTSITVPTQFEYTDVTPQFGVTSLMPTTGDVAGGDPVTITGTGFDTTATTTVFFGSIPADNVQVVNENTITATTPEQAAGPVDVVVTQGTTNTDTLTDGFTYTDVTPQFDVTSLMPTTGDIAGGETVAISGTGFDTTATVTVTFGGIPADNVQVVNENTITATTPAHAAGSVNVVVSQGQNSDTLPNGFTFETQYVLNVQSANNGSVTVSPAPGPYEPGTVVTLTPMADDCFLFDFWAGVDANDVTLNQSTMDYQITMDSDKTVQPVFAANQAPAAPALMSPDMETVDPFNDTTLTVDRDSYIDPDNHAFGMTYWRIENSAGTQVVYQDKNEAYAYTVPGMTLDSHVDYYWTAKFVDVYGCASDWATPVMFNTNIATDANDGGNGVPDAVESGLTQEQEPSSKIAYQTDDPNETKTIRVTAKGDTPAEVKLLAPKDIAAVDADLQEMGVVETVYAAGFKTASDQQGADVSNVSVQFDSWPNVDDEHKAMLYIYNHRTSKFDEIDPDGLRSASSIDLSGLLADGNDYDADMKSDGKISVPYLAVGIVQEDDCLDSITIVANDVTGSGGGTGDFSDTVLAVFNFSVSVSGGSDEGYTYDWTIEKIEGEETVLIETFEDNPTPSHRFESTGDFKVTVTATKEGCPPLEDVKTVSIGEFHDDNCFIASSAAGVSGFFGLASLIAGLAGAIAWRKRR